MKVPFPLLFPPCEVKVDVLGMKRLWDIIWEGNIPRQHAVEKVFNCNGQGDGLEIMLYGTVTMNLPKEDVTLDWAGHMTLEEVNGGLRIKDYYVYGVYPFDTELTSGKQRTDGSNGATINLPNSAFRLQKSNKVQEILSLRYCNATNITCSLRII
jgi:hypothetical protein